MRTSWVELRIVLHFVTAFRGTISPACRRRPRAPAIDARQPVAVGRDRAQHRLAFDLERVQENAVEIIARLFGRDGELGLLDQALEVAAGRVKRCVNSPAVRSGKSKSGNACKMKRERPERSEQLPGFAGVSRRACAPSGSLRTMS